MNLIYVNYMAFLGLDYVYKLREIKTSSCGL